MKISLSFRCLITQGLWLGLRTLHSRIVNGKCFPNCITECWSPSLIGKEKLNSAASSNDQNLGLQHSLKRSLVPMLTRSEFGEESFQRWSTNWRYCKLKSTSQTNANVGYWEKGKTGAPGKNLSVQREPTNSPSLGSNPGHIGGRLVLSPTSGQLLCRKQGHE